MLTVTRPSQPHTLREACTALHADILLRSTSPRQHLHPVWSEEQQPSGGNRENEIVYKSKSPGP